MSHPVATFCIHDPALLTRVAAQRIRKSRCHSADSAWRRPSFRVRSFIRVAPPGLTAQGNGSSESEHRSDSWNIPPEHPVPSVEAPRETYAPTSVPESTGGFVAVTVAILAIMRGTKRYR